MRKLSARSAMARYGLSVFLGVLVICCEAGAQTQEASNSSPRDLTITAGVKIWSNRWSSWQVANTNVGVANREVISPLNSGTSTSLIPQLSLRYKDFLASASVMSDTNYTLDRQWNDSRTGSRSELDANAGYYVLPGLAATLGYKRLQQRFGGEFTWSGPTLGVNLSASLSQAISSYGALAIGRMNARLPSPDGAGKTTLKADYLVSEAGIAYVLGNSGMTWLRGGALTVGYRFQTVSTKGYTLRDTNVPVTTTAQDVRDTTQGFSVGLVASF